MIPYGFPDPILPFKYKVPLDIILEWEFFKAFRAYTHEHPEILPRLR